MFKKYFAFELKNTYKMPLVICLLVIGVSFLLALSAIFELDSLFTIAICALIATFIASIVMSVVSMNKSITSRLFNKGGYLTLTLPVGTHTVLFSKILVNFIYAFGYILSFFIGVILILFGLGTFATINEMVHDVFTFVCGLLEKYQITLIVLWYVLVGYLFVLCSVLFCNSIIHSGFIHKPNKIKNFLIIVIFIAVLTFIFTIEIIPFVIVYYPRTGEFRFGVSEYESLTLNSARYVFSISHMFWMNLGIVGFYFSSYYLIKNKIDVL